MISTPRTIVIIGAGAAGFFGAIACAQANPDLHVILLEKTRQPLAKVRISGGGRCNVTHSCFEPSQLVQNYPRGNKALRGPFTRFQPKDTIHWFESRGVQLKTENDGRMFPVTDNSETIINCLTQAAKEARVDLRIEHGVETIQRTHEGYKIILTKGGEINCDRLLLTTGSNVKAFSWIESLGHKVEPLVPSLFTFNVPDSPLLDISGISVPKAQLKIENTSLEQTGPLLITHWGFSGPAVLKLSAWGARILHDLNYQATLSINWLPQITGEEIREKLIITREAQLAKMIFTESPFDMPRNLWKKLASQVGIQDEQRWSSVSKKIIHSLVETLHANKYKINGKSIYKEEFVTCGGVKLEEVNFKNMESKICPGLYFAGEVLDIDGVTGGFNFQNAWTTSWIAGSAMAQ